MSQQNEYPHIETLAIHGSMRESQPENSPIVPGIEMSTIYEHRASGHLEGDLKYTRLNNPIVFSWKRSSADWKKE